MQLTGFDGTIALVTGASGGIGEALVQLLRKSGCTVVATDRIAPIFADAVAAEGAAQLPPVHAMALDVTDSHAVDALVAHVEQDIGPIGFGINVAGVLQFGTVESTDDDTWRRTFAVNADGVFYVSRALARVMTPRRQGAMVTVGSNAAGIPRHAMAAYAASKAAAAMFMRCLGLELAPLGIRCNNVAPGSTLTPMQTGMWADASGEQRVIDGIPEAYKTGIPLGKLASPTDIANAVMFLLSEQAGHIVMGDVYVDGGATLRA
ncbi:MAG: 2,3-dihydro-2,3-dihydroxybenzoate dehydrogenase [Pseudomonas sp.]|nr:2,3-dihydro-2,3-dihydroxybenzoate dehydrogenase [Pseudomonas sp.]